MVELFTTEQAAKMLRLSSATLAGWRCLGVGPEYLKMGGKVRYTEDILLKYIESCRTNGVKRLTSQ